MERLTISYRYFCETLHNTPLKNIFNTIDCLCGCYKKVYGNCKQLVINTITWALIGSIWLQVVQDRIFYGVTEIEKFCYYRVWVNFRSFYVCLIKSLSVGFFKAGRNTTPSCDHSHHVCFWSTLSFFNLCVLFYYVHFLSWKETIHMTTGEREGTSRIPLY